MFGFHCEVSGRGLVGWGFHADDANQSVQGTPIAGRADSFVRAMVPSISFGLRAYCRDDDGTGHSGRWQLHLALGPSVCRRAEQEMSSAFEVDEQELPRRLDIYY